MGGRGKKESEGREGEGGGQAVQRERRKCKKNSL